MRFSVLRIGTTKEFAPICIVVPANTDILKRDFHPMDLLLSLAIQTKIRLEKMGTAKPEDVHTAIQTIAERSGFKVTTSEDLKALGTPEFTAAYFMDVGKVMVVDHQRRQKRELKNIGPLLLNEMEKERVAMIASRLRKLASIQT